MASHKFTVGQTVFVTKTWYPYFSGHAAALPVLGKGSSFKSSGFFRWKAEHRSTASRASWTGTSALFARTR